jgi:hypothetical protein
MSLINIKYKVQLAFWLWILGVADVRASWSCAQALMNTKEVFGYKGTAKDLGILAYYDPYC